MTPENQTIFSLMAEIARQDWSKTDPDRDADLARRAAAFPDIVQLIECSAMAKHGPGEKAGRWQCWVTPEEFRLIVRHRLGRYLDGGSNA